MELEKHVNVDTPIDEAHPVLQFQYKYPYAFGTIAAAFVQKYNYEPRTHLTTTTNIQQLDEDRVMFYRRADQINTDQISYERVIIDRRDGGKITSELIRPRPGGERLFERGVIEGQSGDNTLHNHFVFDHQGIKTWKVEFFKLGVEKIIKAVKFAQFEQQE
jgi:hypothetical protein